MEAILEKVCMLFKYISAMISTKHVHSLFDFLQLDNCGRRLLRLSELLIQEYPKCNHTIPNAAELKLGKIGTGGVITTDNFNGA